MRMMVCVAAAAAAMLCAAPAEASAYGKRKYKKVYKPTPQARTYDRYGERGHNPTEPDSWRVGSIEWWRAMNYQGRAGRRF